MKGIDISGWQAGFNVAAADADFVFIKATGGGSFTSAEFYTQTASAEASGKPHGFYHYASEKGCGADPITEANHFLNTVAGHVGPSTGIALDWEETNLGNTAWVYQWLEHVSASLGRDPSTIFLYMSQATVNAYDWSAVINAGYRLWCAQYPTMAVQGYGPITAPPMVRWGSQGITMWQYTSAGRVSGWSGNLDLNTLYTDWDTIHGGATVQADTITHITPPEEPDMKAILATDGTSPDVWIGDGITRRKIATLDTLNAVTYLKDLFGLDTTVQTVPDLWALGFPVDAGVDGINANVKGVPLAILEATFPANGVTANVAGILAHIDGKPAVVAANGAAAPFDADAFIARIVATLPPAIRADLKNAL